MDKAASIQYFFTVHDSEARKEGECIFNRIAETSSSNDDDDDEKTCLFYSNRQQREFPVRSRMPRAHYFERLRKIHTFDLLAFHDRNHYFGQSQNGRGNNNLSPLVGARSGNERISKDENLQQGNNNCTRRPQAQKKRERSMR
mmetsp:Transcript_13332/g.37540  ORF Transcript_13332/g.37540 Transcript_13332/m.37540 type:complete len:143 (+) Transcript_13332:1654-2082(+)